MKSFREYLTEKTANTILADINEIYTGYVINGYKWFDNEAKTQFDARSGQAKPEEVEDAIGKAEAMAKEFVKWAKMNGYSSNVIGVWWTARMGSMTAAVGKPVDQKKNPTDILVRFSSGPADGFLGLSAKATKTKGDIGFKNPGVGTVDRNLSMTLGKIFKEEQSKVINDLNLPSSAKDRKAFIRNNPDVKEQTEAVGKKLLSTLRDILFEKLSTMDQDTLLKYILSDWMDAEILYPPYIKVTGNGRRPPYSATVVDPIKNPKLDALSNEKINLSRVGNDSIGVMAGSKKIMKMRFKFESEKMASSMKLSGDPW